MVIRNNITAELVQRHLKKIDDETKSNLACGYQRPSLTINFYEWSNIFQTPRVFKMYYEFFKFCSDSGIKLDDEIREEAYDIYGVIFATCKKGKPELLLSKTYLGLKNLLEHS